jgi:ubiquinone/menaquinone biosynthesis C-methylase UbiE
VSGIFLWLLQNISTASWLYVGDNCKDSNLSYVEGNAHALECHPDIAALSPDVIFCIEAAFHFDRPAFLQSAARLLEPGGRLVIVDFMWHEAAAAGEYTSVHACREHRTAQSMLSAQPELLLQISLQSKPQPQAVH